MTTSPGGSRPSGWCSISSAKTPTSGCSVSACFDHGARLRADRLIEVGDDASRTWPLIAQPLRLDRQVRRLLIGGGDLDERLASVVRLSEAVGDVGSLPLSSAVAAQVSAVAALLKGEMRGSR